jgi:alpha-L-fucosidase 2
MAGSPVSRRAFLGGAAAGALGVALPAAPALFTAGPAAMAAAAVSLNDRMTGDRAWNDFLGGLDLVWSRVPASFYEGPFLGNGGLGAAGYRRGTRLSFTLGDSRVRDHQSAGGTNFGSARLPIGYLTLDTAGDVTDVDLRLSLWNAELSGMVTTTAGVLQVRAYVHARRDVLVVAVTPLTGTERVAWTFTPLPARSPRLDFHPAPDGLLTNPDPVVTTASDGGTCVQDLAAGGQTVTRWQARTEPDAGSNAAARTLLVTVAHSYPGTEASTVSAQTLNAATATSLGALTGDHRSWWHAFYPKSFVSIPDGRLQSFYWIQLYKMASATRRDRPVISTIGPWLERTPWPAVWWNLNVELEYWLIYATGHTELDSLSESLGRYSANLVANTPAEYRGDSMLLARTSQENLFSGSPALPGSSAGNPEVGNLTWALHNAWLAYRHTMDDGVLRTLVFPLLRRAINFYLHFLAKDSAGTYHLPRTYSPEYDATRDCNYDLALIHWGCGTLLAANRRLVLNDPLAPKWQDVLDHLVRPPQDSTQGLWIGADRHLTSSHRHYSHLLWFYPLYRLPVTNSTNRNLLTASLNHWLSFTGALQGYTFTGSGSMYAVLGDGTKARAQLITLLDRYIKPNTMYAEAGPVIETPLSGAQTLHDMLVQSWGGVIRVFPAVPSAWADVAAHNLRTEGAFVISAVRRGGTTRFIRVQSLAGEPCRVAPGNLAGPYEVQPLDGTPGPIPWQPNSDGTLQITLARNQQAVIFTQGTTPDLTIAPVGTGTPRAYWGLPPTSASTAVNIAAILGNDGITGQGGMQQAAATRYEAEAATISQGVVESNHAGFSGTGFVNYANVAGGYVEWTVAAASAGPMTLAFRYANGGTADRPMDITVNGAPVADELAFPPTGAWATWQTVTTTATLAAGTNRIRATATTANGGPNVDWLEVDAAATGGFDGSGYSYPAEEMPPPGLFVSGHVTWTFPRYLDGPDNLVAAGQTATVPSGKYGSLHVLGAAVRGPAEAPVTLRYSDGSTALVTLRLSDWGRPPGFGERIAVQTTHRHSATGDDPLRVRILHQVLPVDPARTLTSFTLPAASRMHLFAITLQQA